MNDVGKIILFVLAIPFVPAMLYFGRMFLLWYLKIDEILDYLAYGDRNGKMHQLEKELKQVKRELQELNEQIKKS